MATSMTKTKIRPKVGLGVFVTNKAHPGSVLLGIRKGSAPGAGEYALPGGHLEFGESWEECAVRETLEETGLVLENVKYCTVVNAVQVEKDYHYISIFMQGETTEEPTNLEPDKCEGWIWCEWDNFPSSERLFCDLIVMRKENKYNPFDGKCTENGT